MIRHPLPSLLPKRDKNIIAETGVREDSSSQPDTLTHCAAFISIFSCPPTPTRRAGFMQLKTRGGWWSFGDQGPKDALLLGLQKGSLFDSTSVKWQRWVLQMSFPELPLQINILVRLTRQLKLQFADQTGSKKVNSSVPSSPQIRY